jgi:hypothetical protein
METFKKSYAPYIDLMPRSEEWPIDRDIEPIMHHLPRKQHGIPKKVRRRGVNENEPYESVEVSHKGYEVHYENCGQQGHNDRGYTQPDIKIGRSGPRGLGSQIQQLKFR